jgi:hypothetical protein
MPRAASELDEDSEFTRELELTLQKTKLRNHRIEIAKLKQSLKLKKIELEAKDGIITRLLNANDYLTRTAKPEEPSEPQLLPTTLPTPSETTKVPAPRRLPRKVKRSRRR